jgi:hypothetical protein
MKKTKVEKRYCRIEKEGENAKKGGVTEIEALGRRKTDKREGSGRGKSGGGDKIRLRMMI